MTMLETIDGPSALRRLDYAELSELAGEIRQVLVDTVLETGGHLGSNLGVVELTLALHRVYDSPRDVIIWDTGHQAYVHKLVTGRRNRFTTLRQRNGMAGYPSRTESEHDWLENSHASAALSHAAGIAAGRQLTGEGGRVVVVVGDGALTGGMAYEAINNIGHRRLPVTIVINYNGRSYAPTASQLCASLRAGRTGFFNALGLPTSGPIDGHSVAAVEDALRASNDRDDDGPIVIHVVTTKGCGYVPAESDAVKCMHDVSPPARGSGAPAGQRYTDVFSRAIVAAARRDPRVVAITAAMPDSTGLLPFATEFPDRFFDVGIAEQHAVASAAGLAAAGMRPVVAIYSTFLTRAFDQVNLDVALHRQPVVFCIDRAGITGPDGASHHGALDMMLLSKVPGMVVMAPSSAQELEVMLADALMRTEGPTAIRWPSAAAPIAPPGDVGSGLRARRVMGGADVCFIGVGRMVDTVLGAAQCLREHGIAATVWDARVVAPLDPTMLRDAGRHPLVVTVEDGVVAGGAGTAVTAALARLDRPHSVALALGLPAAFIPHGNQGELFETLGLTADAVAATVLDALPAARRAALTLA